MDDDSGGLDKGSDPLPKYDGADDAEEAVTVSISTAPGEWLVNTADSVVVPMSMAEVVDALRAGRLTERSLVWRNGMQEWLQVERVPQLKLAARLPAKAAARPAPRLSPPPKPAKSLRTSTAPLGTPRPSLAPEVASTPRPSRPPSVPPAPRASRPPMSVPRPALAAPRPAIAPRPELPPPPGGGDSALAVYDRPAATISFELVRPEAPVASQPPASAPPSTLAPETLAPTTTESVPSRPAPRNSDLSVVAASQFRAQKRSWQRWLWLSSAGSAAAASLLTFWLARGSATSERDAAVSAASSHEVEAPPVTSSSVPAVAPLPAPVVVAAQPAPSRSATPPAKPKVKRKARAWHPPRAASGATTAPATATTSDPSADPNPYDVKLAEEPSAPAPATASEAMTTPEPSSDGDAKAETPADTLER